MLNKPRVIGRDLPRRKMDSWAFCFQFHILLDPLKIENIASSMMESVKRQVPIAERKSYLALVTYQILLFAIYLMQLSRMTSLFISL